MTSSHDRSSLPNLGCWGAPISPERVAELRELADRQRTRVVSAPADRWQSRFDAVALSGGPVG